MHPRRLRLDVVPQTVARRAFRTGSPPVRRLSCAVAMALAAVIGSSCSSGGTESASIPTAGSSTPLSTASGGQVTAATLAKTPPTSASLQTTTASGGVVDPVTSPGTTLAAVPPSDFHRVFPIESGASASYGRTHHDYPATDIFAHCGSGALAVVDGTVDGVGRTDLWTKKVNDPTTRGGLYVSINGDDGVRYYSSHLQSIEDAVLVGARVVAGQIIGRVGRTGDASACHVHFGISPPCESGEWWVRRGVIWPSTYLDAWRQGTPDSPAAEITAWAAAHPTACTSPESMPWAST